MLFYLWPLFIQRNGIRQQSRFLSLIYGPSVCIINIINDSHCFHRYNSRLEGFNQSCACILFYPSFFTAEHVQKVFERTAAPESKEDLVSLFVTVWTANHHCVASSVVTCLNGTETGDDVSRSIWSSVSLQCTRCTMCVYKQSRGEVELLIFTVVILILMAGHEK